MSTPIDRRQALGVIGTVGLGGLLAACGQDSGAGSSSVAPRTTTSALLDEAGSCTLTVEQTEGPYFFDADRVRSDIREDREGARLRLALRVRDAATCKPIPDAVVDVWHADAGGDYSGFDGGAAGTGGGGGGGAPTATRYLRGAQITDADGVVEFTTIYPGWYPGRTVHIHATVHLSNTAVLTTQLYFDDALSARVYERAAYGGRGERDQRNDGDAIFDASLIVTTKADGNGYLAVKTFDVRSA